MAPIIKAAWFNILCRALTLSAFHRISVTGHPVPTEGAILYVGLHRNGALDGLVYRKVDASMKFTLSSHLRRHAIMRLLFDGIELVRAKDREHDATRVDNADSFAACVAHLVAGGKLLYFPEGTSELGPHHLPFHPGIAKLVTQALQHIPKVTVVPLAAHYEAATAWQRDVEVEVGEAMTFEAPATRQSIMARITTGLETVGLDCASLAQRESVEAMAYAATLGVKNASYAKALHALADEDPRPIREMQLSAQLAGLKLHQGIPLIPLRAAWAYLVLCTILSLIVVPAAILNSPVIGLAQYASVRFPDAPNVRSLYRMLGGSIAAICWLPLMCGFLAYAAGVPACIGYLVLTVLGLKSAYRWQKLMTTIPNLIRGTPALRAQLKALHQEVTSRVAAGQKVVNE